ncbi:MAG: hypothetical protein R2741_08530 [Methanolobus sp.]
MNHEAVVQNPVNRNGVDYVLIPGVPNIISKQNRTSWYVYHTHFHLYVRIPGLIYPLLIYVYYFEGIIIFQFQYSCFLDRCCKRASLKELSSYEYSSGKAVSETVPEVLTSGFPESVLPGSLSDRQPD